MTHPQKTIKKAKSNQKQHPLTNSGMGYFFKGFELIQLKGIRSFVIIPLLINIVFFSVAFYFMFIELEHYMDILMGWLPSWLNWLSSVLWPLVVVTILIIFSFIFSYLTIKFFLNFIKKFSLVYFVIYRILLGVLILFYSYWI